MTLTTSVDWAYYLLICGVMGITGQFIRAIGGAKKVNDQAASLNVGFKDVFDWSKFLTSMTTGFAAGIIAGLALRPNDDKTQFFLGILAAGYAGTDFIEAFLKKSLPDVQQAAKISGASTMLREDKAINVLKPETPEAV